MNKLQFLMMMGICAWMLPGHARAQEPWGTMSAEPNPCRIEPGESTCTSFIRWDTQGVERAKVFVTAEGRRSETEHEFSASRFLRDSPLPRAVDQRRHHLYIPVSRLYSG